MRYWWVNQNQTFRQEQAGGYLWSPKRNANGARDPFYEAMRKVSPGDVIFSFSDTFVAAAGIAQSYCWESPRPAEFGTAGQYWEDVGWKVRVQFTPLNHRVRPKDHMQVLRPLLPARYSPLQPNGNGIQSVYLTELPPPLAETLAGLIAEEAQSLTASVSIDAPMQTSDDLDYWEHQIETRIEGDPSIPATDREAIIRARCGQGIFKQRVMEIEQAYRNGENGLLLTPSIDHLFDRGFIGFEGKGNLIISPVAHQPSLERMGIDTRGPVNVGGFMAGQREFLEYHREMVLLKVAR